MDINITYPPVAKRRRWKTALRRIAGWTMLTAAVVCPLVNLLTGGRAWSIVVLMSLYMAWTLLLSPDLVEYNRISQFIKLITDSCVLLALIDIFLAFSWWSVEVVPIVSFCGLIVSGVLFFTDLQQQKQNMRPMLMLIFLSLIGSVIGLSVWKEESRWALIVMGATALALLIACVVVLGSDFRRELKRRFHTK